MLPIYFVSACHLGGHCFFPSHHVSHFCPLPKIFIGHSHRLDLLGLFIYLVQSCQSKLCAHGIQIHFWAVGKMFMSSSLHCVLGAIYENTPLANTMWLYFHFQEHDFSVDYIHDWVATLNSVLL